MDFITKIDFSGNRQVRQEEQTMTNLSGRTDFGLTFADLSSGPKLSTSAITHTYTNVVTTFSGNNSTTIFNFGVPEMIGGEDYLNVITPINSDDYQEIDPYFVGVNPTVNPNFGNTVYQYYSGSSFDFQVTNFTEVSPNNYTGTAISEEVVVYSADTFDYSGDGIWVNVNGKLQTENLIVSSGATAGFVLTCVDSSGKVAWGPAASGSTTGSSGTHYWTGGTGLNSVKVIGTTANASGTRSMALGTGTASGTNAVAFGSGTTAVGVNSFAIGGGSASTAPVASGASSFAMGRYTVANGDNSFAGGSRINSSGKVYADGNASFIFTVASNQDCFADGLGAVVLGGLNNSTTGAASVILGGTDNHNNSVECVVGAGSNNAITGTTLRSVVFAGDDNIITNGNQSGIFAGKSNRLIGAQNSVILGGNDITGNTSNTAYVPALNIGSIGVGPSTTDIGVNAQGFVVDVLSDLKLKENINTIEDALTKVLALRGVTYNWKDRESGGDNVRIGLIAQEVAEVVPELTFVGSDGEHMGVHYANVTALLIEAIKILAGSEVNKSIIETQSIVAEDNNIELNYNGNHESSLNGGIKVIDGVDDGVDSDLVIDGDGDWGMFPNFKLKNYTPTSTEDTNGNVGNMSWDDNYLYIKRNNGWGRVSLENF